MSLKAQNITIEKLYDLVIDMHQGINTVSEKIEYQFNGIPIIQSKHITKGFLNLDDTKFVNNSDYIKYKEKYQPNIDDVLVCNIGTIGKSLRIDKLDTFLIAWNLFLIKLDKTKLYSQYFAHYLNHLADINYFDKFLTGGTVKFINKKTMGNIEIPLPPLDQQKKIASILDAADAYRQKTKALISKYDELTQSLFLDMFGDPVKNEKGWEKVELKTLCDFKKSNIKPEDIKNGNIYIGLECIEKNTGNIVEKFVVTEGEVKSNKFWFSSEYILYGKLRPYLNKVATPDFEGVCSTDIIPLKPKLKKASKHFIVTMMRGEWFVSFANERTSGANLPRISPSEIEKYKTINPPFSLQTQFAERVQAIEQQKAKAQESLEKAEELFNSLLQKAFNGELV